MTRAVILFKSPPTDVNNDPYITALNSAGYRPYFVEVLQSNFANQDALSQLISVGPSSANYSGVVFTSSRAAAAWIHALDEVNNIGNWSETPFYVIGQATAHPLRKMANNHPGNFSASLILGAEESGHAESLAKFVLLDMPSRNRGSRLLCLVGDKNRDTFPSIMAENDIHLENLMVYETAAASDLDSRVSKVVQEIKLAEHPSPIWFIFFAPSSAGFVMPHLRIYFCLSTMAEPCTHAEGLLPVKIGAIGLTTSKYLHTDQGLHVHVVASEPTASCLAVALCESDAATMEDIC